MIDKVQIINEHDLAEVCTVLRKLHKLSDPSVGEKRECPSGATPLSARKARKLIESPTDVSLA